MKKIVIVGAGLFGAVCAYELSKKGYEITVIDKRHHIGGNCYTEKELGITYHSYGAHIFHTKNESIWKYINKFSKFNNYVHKVYSIYKGKPYSIPFNNLTYQQVFSNGCTMPLSKERMRLLVNMFIKNYSEKQWNMPFKQIPVDVIKRLPFKYSYNTDYFENQYQGIPLEGYTEIFKKLLRRSKVMLNQQFMLNDSTTNTILIYTGRIDDLFDYRFGKLDFRSLRFEKEYIPDVDNFQYNSVMNYPETKVPYLRIIEHKHFEFNTCKGTIITREYPTTEGEPLYPINDVKNNAIYKKYLNYANQYYPHITFGGRLGSYTYIDMDKTIEEALALCEKY